MITIFRCHAIGISHGFGAIQGLLDAVASRVITGLAELPQLIEAHNSGKELLF